jgi:hypothetical protein
MSQDSPGRYGRVGNGKGINIYPGLDPHPYRVAIPDIIRASLAITAGSGAIPEPGRGTTFSSNLYIITRIVKVSLANKAGQAGSMVLILNRLRGNEAADVKIQGLITITIAKVRIQVELMPLGLGAGVDNNQ